MRDLAIVIVSFNARADLEACLTALADHPPSTPHAIVVVDNASTDGSAVAVRTRWSTVTVIDAGDNLGFARATNLGIRATASRCVLLLNPDTLPPVGAIPTGWSGSFVRDRTWRSLAPRLVDRDGTLEVSFGSMISPVAELWQKCLVRGHGGRLPLLTGLVERRARVERRVDWVSGACLLVRRSDAEAAGLLDEAVSSCMARTSIFCATIRGLGRDVLYTPAVEVVHHRGRSGQDLAGEHGVGLSPESPRLLPEAPSRLVPGAPSVSPCARATPPAFPVAAGRETRGGTTIFRDADRYRRPEAARLRHRHVCAESRALASRVWTRSPSTF